MITKISLTFIGTDS